MTVTAFTLDSVKNMTKEEIVALLNAKAARKVFTKVAPTGALSIYGFGQFPITVYKQAGMELFGDGATRDMVLKALADPELSQGKDDPRYTAALVEARRAATKAAKEAKK